MKRNGKSKSGRQRWYCRSCQASYTHKIDTAAKLLAEFLSWLLSRRPQKDMPGAGRNFRRKTAQFWKVWPLAPVIDEIYRVIYVDGIYLDRRTVVLIAASDKYVLGWYLARSENAQAYAALLSRIAAPEMVVTDGGSGFRKAQKRVWPDTRVQRCLFHVFCQVKRYTTSRPKLPAGKELYQLAKELLHIADINSAIAWLKGYNVWCLKWKEFLKETTCIDRHEILTHQRLIRARNSLNALIRQKTLFTYLDPALTEAGQLPSTNNAIEGGVNAQLRALLRDHRGLRLTRRIKAVFWWCYLHTEYPMTAAQILKVMPTDDDIDSLYRSVQQRQEWYRSIPSWGDAIVWEEFHLPGPRRLEWD